MIHDVSLSFNPIGPWPVLLGASAIVTGLTLWAYSRRLKGSEGRWRYVAVALRLLALLLCLLAALRPSVYLNEKKKHDSSLVFLIDTSTSMEIGDEVRGQTRWDIARQVVKQAREFAKTLGPDLDLRFYRFDSRLARAQGRRNGGRRQALRARNAARLDDAGSTEKNGKQLAPTGEAGDRVRFRQ